MFFYKISSFPPSIHVPPIQPETFVLWHEVIWNGLSITCTTRKSPPSVGISNNGMLQPCRWATSGGRWPGDKRHDVRKKSEELRASLISENPWWIHGESSSYLLRLIIILVDSDWLKESVLIYKQIDEKETCPSRSYSSHDAVNFVKSCSWTLWHFWISLSPSLVFV